MITRDNIQEVLIHNSIGAFGILDPECSDKSELVLHNQKTSKIECRINLNNPNLIKIIEAHYGKKLEALPDEEIVLKVGDEVINCVGRMLTLIKFDYVNEEIIYTSGIDDLCGSFKSIQGFKSVNGKQGKFVIPPFDFKQTLLDAGWLIDDDNDDIIGDGAIWINLKLRNFCDEARQIKLNPANAARLIKLSELAEELEHE